MARVKPRPRPRPRPLTECRAGPASVKRQSLAARPLVSGIGGGCRSSAFVPGAGAIRRYRVLWPTSPCRSWSWF